MTAVHFEMLQVNVGRLGPPGRFQTDFGVALIAALFLCAALPAHARQSTPAGHSTPVEGPHCSLASQLGMLVGQSSA